jgi:hypothetical protein
MLSVMPTRYLHQWVTMMKRVSRQTTQYIIHVFGGTLSISRRVSHVMHEK